MTASPADPDIDHPRGSMLAIRHCLAHLIDDALAHDLCLPALHMRIAILEIDDLLGLGEDAASRAA